MIYILLLISSTIIVRKKLKKWIESSWSSLSNGIINPRTAGGGGYQPAPLRFSQIAKKTAARSVAKFAIAVQPTIWHIFKQTMIRWPQRSRLQVKLSDLTSSCIFQSLRACQRLTKDPNSLKLVVCNTDIGIHDFYISDFLYRWPKVRLISWPPHYKSMGKNWSMYLWCASDLPNSPRIITR